MSQRRRSLVDFVLLQAGWFACVLAGAAANPWVGPASAVVLIAVHLGWCAEDRRLELRNVLVFGLAGCAIDALQVRLGVICPAGAAQGLAGVPGWLAGLWFLFPIVFNSSFVWLHPRPVATAILAAVGAPLSYQGGAALGALEIGAERWAALGSLGLAWAIYLPVALRLGQSKRNTWNSRRSGRPGTMRSSGSGPSTMTVQQ